ncbi:MAG: hypothetical protein PHD79_08825 [Aliarcobacter sp.]|nr:hypothetical protein [Aliarcobacter sp.]
MSKNEKPKLILDKFTHKQINEWVLEKLESNPTLYGGDIGNPFVMQSYTLEIQGIDLPLEFFSSLSSVSRKRNLILKDREDLDFRELYAIDREKEDNQVTKPFPEFLE